MDYIGRSRASKTAKEKSNLESQEQASPGDGTYFPGRLSSAVLALHSDDEEEPDTEDDGGSGIEGEESSSYMADGQTAETERERTGSPLTVIESPNHDDIIVGRGHGVNNRPGNRAFRSMIQANCERYFQLQTKTHRSAYARELVRELKLTRRFLEPLQGRIGYIELDSKRAENKVGQVC
jgi:hypothetical protein